jgi:hypothetical protein
MIVILQHEDGTRTLARVDGERPKPKRAMPLSEEQAECLLRWMSPAMTPCPVRPGWRLKMAAAMAEYSDSQRGAVAPPGSRERVMRVLLARATGQTMASLAKAEGVSRERIRQLEAQGLRVLRRRAFRWEVRE